MAEFEVGDIVEVFAPDDYEGRHDYDVFNAGWADGDMEEHIGQTGEVFDTTILYGGSSSYCIRFSDGKTWWWDPRYMIQKTEKEASKIPIEDFDSILNRGDRD